MFVPGVANGLLPSKRIQQNPAERGYSLDFELRGDAEILPAFDGVPLALQARPAGPGDHRGAPHDVRRAHARAPDARGSARRTGTARTREREGPQRVLRRAGGVGRATGDAEADAGPGGRPESTENPMLGYRARFVRDWPGPARPDDADELFPDGLARARRVEAAAAGGVAAVAARDARRRRPRVVRAPRRRAAASSPTHLREREAAEGGPAAEGAPQTALGERRHRRTRSARSASTGRSVRPLPRFSGPAARIGTEIHGWIERRARGQGQLLEVDDAPDLTDEELAGDPGRVERLRQAFLDEPVRRRHAAVRRARVPAAARRLRAWAAGSTRSTASPTVRGRSSTGRPGRSPPTTTRSSGLQLDLYGLACVEIWGKRPQDLTLTYVYLTSGEEVVRTDGRSRGSGSACGAAAARSSGGAFEPTPGPACRYCDFRAFCEPGQALVAAQTPERSDRRGARRAARSCLRTSGSPAAGSNPPSVTPGTRRADKPGLRRRRGPGTRHGTTPGRPGWICTSPLVPRRR